MLVENAVFIKDKGKILNTLSELSFNPYSTVIIEKENVKRQSMAGNSFSRTRKGDVQILTYLPNRIDLETTSLGSAYLLLNETYYPGWKAFVDEKRERIYPANLTFRAIPLKEGTHQITLLYQPLSFTIGATLSILALVLSGLLIFFNTFK